MIRQKLVEEVRLAGWDLLTIQEVAALAGLSYVTIWRHTNEGKLPFVKLGGAIRIRRRDALRYFNTNPDDADANPEEPR
jgi:excisionase family DNA binding protein